MKETKSPQRSTRGNRNNKSKTINDGVGDSPSFKVPLPKSSRTRRDSSVPQIKIESPTPTPTKVTRATHSRASSLSSVRRALPSDLVLDSKATSSVKPKSIKRQTTPEDDAVSIAESSKSKSGIVRRTEAERIQYLRDDPYCIDIEPFRASCNKCSKRVSLGRRTTYALQSWIKHRERCDKTAAEEEPDDNVEGEESSTDEKPDATIPPTSPSGKNSDLTESQKQAIIETDPRAEVVEADRARCRKCRKWIKLGTKLRYGGISQWLIHQMKCHHSLQAGRAADAARAAMIHALQLTKDAQVSTFSFGTVECAVCGEHVALKPEHDYDLTRWDDHKSRCVNRLITDADGDLPSVQPPPPSESGESSSRSEGDVAVGPGKRRRDDDDADDGEPPRNRAKKGNTEADSAGVLGWVLHPFRMFVRGFQEGMQGSSS